MAALISDTSGLMALCCCLHPTVWRQVKKAFFALVANGVRAAPLWDTEKQSFVGKQPGFPLIIGEPGWRTCLLHGNLKKWGKDKCLNHKADFFSVAQCSITSFSTETRNRRFFKGMTQHADMILVNRAHCCSSWDNKSLKRVSVHHWIALGTSLSQCNPRLISAS